MAEQYQVTLHSHMGPREGILTLSCEGEYVSGTLKLMGHVNTIHGVCSEDGRLHLFHSIQTAVSTLSCETVLELHEENLTGTTTMMQYCLQLEGTLLDSEVSQPLQKELKL